MKRVLISILVLAGLVLGVSCQQHTCPTYIKAPEKAAKVEARS